MLLLTETGTLVLSTLWQGAGRKTGGDATAGQTILRTSECTTQGAQHLRTFSYRIVLLPWIEEGTLCIYNTFCWMAGYHSSMHYPNDRDCWGTSSPGWQGRATCTYSYSIIDGYHPKRGTHQCKQADSPSCSLDQPLCTRTLHLGFVGSFERWVSQPYYYQLDSPPPCCSTTPVDLVGCTTLSKWALVLWLAHSTLSD